ncbi:hypothetical protein BFW38_06325 [Terasakiispira papahanaumokuakeensis]|uniref:DUF3102 domain-containing protein n=1 Tax=Terasakiispira papahanaumokuakeensis TaxID=197479 RepID=A0A1E2V979_9GAMM|nr:hypothetical protein [Terasakiispira papahanaumokuakeensis]ODC03215.1 hypothetical protein BFW38_06325 [Terasakiispira papahanaumokuakeensis]
MSTQKDALNNDNATIVGTHEENHELAFDVQAVNELQNQAAALTGAHSDERDLVNQILGQVQMANSIARFADVVSLTKLAHIKETRMYKALAGKKGLDPQGNEIADIGTFDGFCRALGLSRSKVDEDLTNLKHFGEEALNNLTAIGIGYREMRQFRKLPDDQKEALIEVAKSGDKESFVELAEEIICKHAKEKEALQKDRDDVRADYDAQSELLSKRNDELDAARFALERAERRLRDATPDEAEKQLKTEISGVAVEIESLFKTRLDGALSTLQEHAQTTGHDQRLYMATLVRQMELELLALREKYALPDSLDGSNQDWMSEQALADAEAVVQQLNGER